MVWDISYVFISTVTPEYKGPCGSVSRAAKNHWFFATLDAEQQGVRAQAARPPELRVVNSQCSTPPFKLGLALKGSQSEC